MRSNALAPLKTWLDAALNLFYPPACQICSNERATVDEGFVCRSCWHGVRFVQRPFCERCGLPYEGSITNEFECTNCREIQLHFSTARSAVIANPLILEVIHHYKYNRALWFEPFLAGLLVQQARPLLQRDSWDMIVPVPLHPVKQREREFNQADRLARHLGAATGLPVRNRLIRRVAPTRTQTLLSRQERADNVRRAFAPCRETSLAGARVVVLDDVMTTGATTSACARVLRKMGAADVCVWTVARGV